jgi:hypothetical protein
MMRIASAAAVALGLAGCAQLLGVDDLHGGAGEVDAPVGASADAAPGVDAMKTCDQVDLLFVIDDSGSMAEEQDNLATNIPEFLRLLDDAKGGNGAPLDYHLGVTTTGRDITFTQVFTMPGLPPISSLVTEMGDDGELKGACGLSRKWLERGDPDVDTVAACRAKVGTAGPSEEMPLLATRLATKERVSGNGPNAGFLRSTAPLVIVVLTDEDDCSREDNNFTTDDPCKPGDLTPVATSIDYLDLLKGRRDLWHMAIVANMSATACSSPFGMAQPATRLRALAAAAPDNVGSTSICSGNLALALDDVLAAVRTQCAMTP